jgi:integrase
MINLRPRLAGRGVHPVPVRDSVALFAGELRRTGRADSTCRKYVQNLGAFVEEFGDRSPGSVTATELDAFLAGWADEFEQIHGRRPAAATVHGRVTALKEFYAYLSRTDRLVDDRGRSVANPASRLELPRRRQKPIDYLTPEEDEALLAAEGTPQEEIIVWLLRSTGIRVGEARQLLQRDFDFTSGTEGDARAATLQHPLSPLSGSTRSRLTRADLAPLCMPEPHVGSCVETYSGQRLPTTPRNACVAVVSAYDSAA